MQRGEGLLVVGEVGADGKARPVSWEMIGAATALTGALGGPITGLLMGSGIGEVAASWGSAGVDRLLVADDPRLVGLMPAAAATVLERAIAEVKPAAVLVPGTTAGRDSAPLVAARLGLGLAADCTELTVEDGRLCCVRPVLGGRAVSRVRFEGNHLPIVTVRPGSFARAEAGATTPKVETFPVELNSQSLRVSHVETTGKSGADSRLDSAAVVISGGRGLQKPDQFVLVEELADAFGGAVGATRAVVDAGWRPHSEQIGQTGKTVSPQLYVAIGISGAVQHNVGMQGAEHIVAVNRDPDAPIFKIASFGIVGDLFEVVPALTAEVRNAKQ